MSKKYLTILSGSPRGGEKTWESLYRNVLNVLDSDLAICTGSKWIKAQSFVREAKYQWIIDEPEDWFDYYRDNLTGSWEDFFNKGKTTGLYNSGAIHFALKDIILKNHLKEVLNYEQIIYTRFDQLYLDYHPDLSNEKIWIPKGEDYYGICDRHAVVPNKYIEKYLNILSYVNSNQALALDSKHINCEVAYLNALHYERLDNIVARYPRSQFTTTLKSDPTNWRVAKYKIYFYNGLMLKYPDEFIDSFKSLSTLQKGKVLFSSDIMLLMDYLYLRFKITLGAFKSILTR